MTNLRNFKILTKNEKTISEISFNCFLISNRCLLQCALSSYIRFKATTNLVIIIIENLLKKKINVSVNTLLTLVLFNFKLITLIRSMYVYKKEGNQGVKIS